jgi:methionine-S-sulfoxide reductase
MKQVLIGLVVLLTTVTGGSAMDEKQSKAIFAGGCFWCMEGPFEKLAGVKSVTSGYTGGTKENPTYEEVCSGTTGHAEAVEVVYDPSKTKYEELLEVYWDNVDPTQANGQFADHGSQYRTAIFYQDAEQKRLAEASKVARQKLDFYKGKQIVTEIVPAVKFWPAEDYHQDYYKKNAMRYEMYKQGSGRAGYIEKVKQSKKSLNK